MFKFGDFLEGIYMFLRNISVSKKAYRTCAVMTMGVMIVAVVSMDSGDFDGGGKNCVNHTSTVQDECECVEVSEEEIAKAEDVQDENGQLSIESRTTVNVGMTILQTAEELTEYTTEVSISSTTDNLVVNKIGLTITQSDYEALQRIVEAEAGNQDERGRMLVANVIVNRVKSEKFANDITGVIFQNNGRTYQFEPILNGYYYEVTVSEETKKAVDKVLQGEDTSGGALYFTMRTSANSWFNTELTLLFVHGEHYFYK